MAANETIEITIPNYGTLRGSVDRSRRVAVFRNVPYAVVPERWRAAVKPQPWTGVRDATKQGPICPQMPSLYPLHLLVPKDLQPLGTGKYQFGLDHDEYHCLNLNIYVPLAALQPDAKPVPVMAWIHGGAYRDGSNAVPLYNASNFVHHSILLHQPVIVIAINYRVNVFGFLASQELIHDISSTSSDLPPYDQSVGNWGLMDQKLAFEWIRSNIAAFGGQTNNITAWGESAGSISIHYHLLTPSHHGLFDHAIMQSGTVNTITPGFPQKEGQPIFDALLQGLGIPLDLNKEEKIKRLRALPGEDLAKVGNAITTGGYRPFYDGGKVIPSKIPIQFLAKDLAAYDPNLKSVLIGANKDEGTAFARLFGELSMQTWPTLLQKMCPVQELMPLFTSIYGTPETDVDVLRIVAKYTGDMMFMYPTLVLNDTLLALAKKRSSESGPGLKVSHYLFDAEMQKMVELVPGLGALHAGELPMLFSPPLAEKVLTIEELALGKEMQRVWIAFANQQEELVHAKSIPFRVAGDRRGIELAEEELRDGGVYMSKDAERFWKTLATGQEKIISTAFSEQA
ncbi:Alpha/Beta hydrolase protein [Gamsiella multidivaricata]|uniref:Alpha/Beta hydrolase protein n=1 Tax=Gamsiella multidivaricata TaxID=101098 RepID=UPI0022207992|nr:Alpha/Beta hydrolase protein [Gamsiella multidivaricata]KAG0371050.1 hypothetical protein BGZ54_000968 [Gamsiella multidivaricata]KAI7828203.1 Alpha/Beta hydrolase protein [Gamsiella multidivaricata]